MTQNPDDSTNQEQRENGSESMRDMQRQVNQRVGQNGESLRAPRLAQQRAGTPEGQDGQETRTRVRQNKKSNKFLWWAAGGTALAAGGGLAATSTDFFDLFF